MNEKLRIISFRPCHSPAFKALNLAWINQHWTPEAADYEVLDNPQQRILDRGGYIAIAELDGEPVGTCALQRIDDQTYELAKMAVDDSARGHGIGQLLGEQIISQARNRGAQRLYLESNTVLIPAINLYRKLGFEQVPMQPSVYERCNIQMVLNL